MYHAKFTTAFRKNYKKLAKRGLDLSLLDNTIEMLRAGKELIFVNANSE